MIVKVLVLLILPLECRRFFLGRTVTLVNIFILLQAKFTRHRGEFSTD